MQLPKDQRDPFYVRSLELTIETKADESSPLADCDYFVLYFGHEGCGRCTQFTPALASFYERVKPQIPRFEVLYICAVHEEAAMRTHIEKSKVPGRNIAIDRYPMATELIQLKGGLMPVVMLLDRHGKLLLRNDPSTGGAGAVSVLSSLEQRMIADANQQTE